MKQLLAALLLLIGFAASAQVAIKEDKIDRVEGFRYLKTTKHVLKFGTISGGQFYGTAFDTSFYFNFEFIKSSPSSIQEGDNIVLLSGKEKYTFRVEQLTFSDVAVDMHINRVKVKIPNHVVNDLATKKFDLLRVYFTTGYVDYELNEQRSSFFNQIVQLLQKTLKQ
jgi:hypothetical protein